MTSAIAKARSSFRHRIQEITLNPTPSKYSIGLELLIDNTSFCVLPAVAPGGPLHWNLESSPCDVQSDSKIKWKIIEKHFPSQRNRVGYSEYLVSDVVDKSSIHLEADNPTSQPIGFSSMTKRWDHGKSFAVSIMFPDREMVEDAYLVALSKVDTVVDSKQGPLQGLGRFRNTLKTLIDVGKVVAEMNSSAKLVVTLCAMVWEHLEKLQKLHDDLHKLLGGLERMLPFVNFVKEHATNNLLCDTITALLNLIEDASNFMLGYLSDRPSVRLLRSPFNGSTSDRVEELLQQFTDLKEDFDRSVRVQLLASVLTSAQRTLIDRLNPAARSHYANTPPCQNGTREQALDDINKWLGNQNATEKLLWLHGHAGQGKSSIASSICLALDSKGTLGTHFFCKRDDPDLRSSERILNTIVHRLSMKYKAYGHAVSSVIDSNTELPSSPLQSRYSNLIEKPLQAFALNPKKQPSLLVVVVDALDECDKGDGRRLLLTYLRGLSTLLPWIKVIVTSRPDHDIKVAFGKPNDSVVCARNIHDYNTSDDIYAYLRKQMTDIATDRNRIDWPDDTVQLLSQRADGLFIWAATACRFISEAVNVDQRLKHIMEGTESSGSFHRLDVLYSTAIRHSMDSEAEDNVEYTRQCVAVIVATVSRTPLSVPSLEILLCNKFGTGTLRYLVDRLGSVLYEDQEKGNAVRVYHPSFADYVTNPARSKEIHVATESINTTLADCCLSTMLRELRFNICGLETSDLLNRDVPKLEYRIQSAIGAHLEYSCIHWTSHLTLATVGVLDSRLGEFLLGPVLLFWIEALSLLSRLSAALSSLLEIRDKMLGIKEHYATCAHDTYRFVLMFYDAILESTPHLYVSALPLAPKKSLVAERMWPLFPNIFRVLSADEHWPACLRAISLSDKYFFMATSPDGCLIATSCSGAVQLWDAETGKAMSYPLECSNGGLAFSHDGRLLFCRQCSGGIQVWNTETLEPVLMALPATSLWNQVIALSCNNHLAVSSPKDHIITVWDLCSDTAIFGLVGHSSDIESIAFSPDDRLIASVSNDGTMCVWSADTGAALFDRSDHIKSVAFSPDSRYVVCGNWGRVQIWDTSTYTPTMELHVSDISQIQSVAYAPNGNSVVVGVEDIVMVWDLDQASAYPTPLVGHTGAVNSVKFSPNGRRIISGSYDGTMRLWDVDTSPTALPVQPGHSAWVNQVLFTPDNLHVLSASHDNTVGTWDATTGRAVRDPIVSPMESPCFSISPNCQRAVFQHGGTMHLWDVSSKTSTALDGTGDNVSALAFTSDSLRLVSACSENHTLQVHDAETGAELLVPIATGQGVIESVAYSPCNRFIASGDGDTLISNCTVRVWSAETGAAVGKPLEGGDITVNALAFSPGGCVIAAGSEYSIQVYEVERGALIHKILLNETTTALAFSPDGYRLASGLFDHTIRVWDMELDTPTSELLLGHTSSITSVAFSHDGNLITSGSHDCTVRIWDAVNTNMTIEASLGRLTSAIDPDTSSSSALTRSIFQVATKHFEPLNRKWYTSHLAHRLKEGAWVSLTEGSILLWLPPDYRVIDDSIVQISARHIPRYSIDFSMFVHGDRWIFAAHDSVRRNSLPV